MGFLLGGPYYHLQGRTGNNVGRVVKGKNTFAMRPAKSNKPLSLLQLAVTARMSLMAPWLSELSPFIKVGFEDYDQEMTPWNAALKYNLQHAITGSYPNFTIDYANVLLSRGKLAKGKSMAVATTEDAQLDFSWLATVPTLQLGGATDKAAFIIYNPSKQEWEVSIDAAVRSGLSYDMMLPADWSGDNVHVWSAFVSVNKRDVSTSEYLGATAVQ
ncbi:MAG: DUF6266 family protein [Bacteroidota bacterium]